MNEGWIGVDLDGTLALYDGWTRPTHIGEPVPLMATRVIQWIREGKDVRIFTARIAIEDLSVRLAIVEAIRAWCRHHLGKELPVTNEKDLAMIELWDDRAVSVEPNTGRITSTDRRRGFGQ